jgi:hypothetical protein
MLSQLGPAGILGFLLMLGGIAVVAVESLVIAAGLAVIVAGLGLVVFGLVKNLLSSLGMGGMLS